MLVNKSKILVDAREFLPNKTTGIGRVLTGLIGALVESQIADEIFLAAYQADWIPEGFRNKEGIGIVKIPSAFLSSEKYLSDMSRKAISVFISPYPKLPLFGCHCKSVHIIHDVLYLTHPVYRKQYKTFFDEFRLKRALKSANLTWYDSSWSLMEARGLTGFAGKNPRVRYPGVDDRFSPDASETDGAVLKNYSLRSGDYILVVGNGLPHKNIGVLLTIDARLKKTFVFVGMAQQNAAFWQNDYPAGNAVYIDHVPDIDMPAVIRGAFCLAQPSTAEGYGYPPLEAMACGIPSVVSRIPVLQETTGGAALIADPREAEAWLEAFNALENQQVYQNQVDKGLKWVEPFRGAKAWDNYISDIQELIGER